MMWRAELLRRYRPLNDYPSLWVLVQKTTYWVQVPATTANSQRAGYANHDLIPEREGQERRKGVTQNDVMR